MRTTVRLPDEVFEEARQYAHEAGTTLTDLFAEALREHLARRRKLSRARRRVELPTFGGRGPLPGVDLHDGSSLLDAMEAAEDART